MALRYLIGTGNVADPTKWDGGVSVPGSGDDCYANGFTGTISADFTVNSLNTTASGPAAAGGGFTCATAVTITCAGGFYAGTTNCLTCTSFGTAVGPSYGSSTTNSRIGLTISGSASHIGDSHGGAFVSTFGTQASNGATHVGDSYGGTASNAQGTSLGSGAIQVGDSHGSTTAPAVGTQASAGTHIGDSYGGGANTAYGTRALGGGYQYGRSFGGSAAGAYGSFVDSGGVCITLGITDSTAPGLTLGNDGAVILQGATTAAQLNITAAAGRYRVDRGVSSIRPFIRGPFYPAFVS